MRSNIGIQAFTVALVRKKGGWGWGGGRIWVIPSGWRPAPDHCSSHPDYVSIAMPNGSIIMSRVSVPIPPGEIWPARTAAGCMLGAVSPRSNRPPIAGVSAARSRSLGLGLGSDSVVGGLYRCPAGSGCVNEPNSVGSIQGSFQGSSGWAAVQFGAR